MTSNRYILHFVYVVTNRLTRLTVRNIRLVKSKTELTHATFHRLLVRFWVLRAQL